MPAKRENKSGKASGDPVDAAASAVSIPIAPTGEKIESEVSGSVFPTELSIAPDPSESAPPIQIDPMTMYTEQLKQLTAVIASLVEQGKVDKLHVSTIASDLLDVQEALQVLRKDTTDVTESHHRVHTMIDGIINEQDAISSRFSLMERCFNAAFPMDEDADLDSYVSHYATRTAVRDEVSHLLGHFTTEINRVYHELNTRIDNVLMRSPYYTGGGTSMPHGSTSGVTSSTPTTSTLGTHVATTATVTGVYLVVAQFL